jgi:hypothetical protein
MGPAIYTLLVGFDPQVRDILPSLRAIPSHARRQQPTSSTRPTWQRGRPSCWCPEESVSLPTSATTPPAMTRPFIQMYFGPLGASRSSFRQDVACHGQHPSPPNQRHFTHGRTRGSTQRGFQRRVSRIRQSFRICFPIVTTTRERREHQIFTKLLQMVPGLEERIMGGSEEEVVFIADLVRTLTVYSPAS